MLWINFLHFYQPANIDSFSVKQALTKSYFRLLRLMEEHKNLHMTWNITGCLLERLADEGEQDFLLRLKKIVESGRLELVSSAAFHGLLPLLPETEVIRQIKENEKILHKFLGLKNRPKGFFFPEMAYSPAVAKIVKRLGYRWIILDEISFAGGKSRPDFRRAYLDNNSGLTVIFRNRAYSNSYPPDKLIVALSKEKINLTRPIITATDAELYGLRHEDPSAELERVVKSKNLSTETISQFLGSIAKSGLVSFRPKASSWESSHQELLKGQVFRLWQDKKNKIHNQLWRLTDLAIAVGDKFPHDKNYRFYRWHLVRGIASCTFWWASARDFSKSFGPYAWSPDGIERGLEDMIRAVRSLDDSKSRKYKLQAESYYLKIKKLVWEEHWRKHWHRAV